MSGDDGSVYVAPAAAPAAAPAPAPAPAPAAAPAPTPPSAVNPGPAAGPANYAPQGNAPPPSGGDDSAHGAPNVVANAFTTVTISPFLTTRTSIVGGSVVTVQARI